MRKVSIPEARILSQSRDYTIHWRPGDNVSDPPERHYAEIERHTRVSGVRDQAHERPQPSA